MVVTGTAGDRYPWEPITIAQLLERTAVDHADRDAMVGGGRRVSWAQARDESRALAKGLIAAGIGHGDHIALWMPNQIEWVELWFATAYIGAVLVTVNTRYKPDEVRYILGQSDARLLIMVREFVGIDYVEMLSRLCPSLATAPVPNADDFPELERVVVLGDPTPAGAQPFAEFVAAGASVTDAELDAAAAAVDYDDATIIVYTSGTTGHPKGAVHSHRILRNEHSISEAMDVGPESRVMNHMPFFHVAGGFTGILPPLITGGAMLVMDRWDPIAAFELIERERASVMGGIPTHFIDLINHPERDRYDTSSLRTGWIGGANNPPEVIDGAITQLGLTGLLPVYGMTETTSITTIARLDDPREIVLAGKGRPVSDFELKIADPDTGEEQPAEVEGEVWVRGHLVMQGYYANEAATAAVLDADGWFRTGDLGMLDDDGYLSITGRRSDMFIVGGSNAYPAEIEIALTQHPSIKQAYVVGVPHDRLGEVGFAFVEPVAGSSLAQQDVVAFCAERLADYKVPRFVELVTDWPMTATGKIERFRLSETGRELASARAALRARSRATGPA